MGADRIIGLVAHLTGTPGVTQAAVQDKVIALFREAFFEVRRERKAEYVRQVLDCHHFTHRQLGKLLGYGPKSSGAIDGARDGKISDDKYDLLRATVARQVQALPQWPSLAELTTLALLRTITRVAAEGPAAPKREITREELECVERVLGTRWREVFAEEGTADLKAGWPALLDEVHRLAGTSELRTLADVERTLTTWGPWYVLCKRVIPGQEG